MAKKVKNTANNLKVILLAFAGMCLGYYLLNYLATVEDILPGPVFYIIAGCLLMAISFIVLASKVKEMYFPKKRKKKSRPVFLEDKEKKNES